MNAIHLSCFLAADNWLQKTKPSHVATCCELRLIARPRPGRAAVGSHDLQHTTMVTASSAGCGLVCCHTCSRTCQLSRFHYKLLAVALASDFDSGD